MGVYLISVLRDLASRMPSKMWGWTERIKLSVTRAGKVATKGRLALICSVVFLLIIARHWHFYEEAANSFLHNSSPCLAS